MQKKDLYCDQTLVVNGIPLTILSLTAYSYAGNKRCAAARPTGRDQEVIER